SLEHARLCIMAFGLSRGEVMRNQAYSYIEGDRRTPPRVTFYFCGRGHSPLHIFKPLFIRLLIRRVANFRVALDFRFHQSSELFDRYFTRASDVKYFAYRGGRLHQPENCSHDIADIAKATALPPVTEDRDGIAFDSLLHKRWHYHAVLAGLSRPRCIEEPSD